MSSTGSAYSQQDPDDSASDFMARQFQINQTLARVRTMVLVAVTGITGGAGAIAAPGTVSVQPLVKLIDGQGNTSSHGIINNIPVFRLGGGSNAVICDPVVGDIGWMAVADRDISAVKANQAESAPGSRRKFDLADGVYMGSLFSGVPVQYVTFTSSGISIVSPNNITLTVGGTSIVIADGTITIGGIVFGTHTHSGVTTGGGDSGPPVP